MTPEQMDAWCEWRKWCSIWRVKDPIPSKEELDWGIVDDKSPEERTSFFAYLKKKVCNAIEVLVKLVLEQNNCDSSFSLINKDLCISAFDEYMKGEKPVKSHGFTGRSYKDYIFHLIASGENFGRVINGKIFGKKSGYIKQIAKKYIVENYICQTGPRGGTLVYCKDPETGKIKSRIDVSTSLFAPTSSSDSAAPVALIDVLSDGESLEFKETYDFAPLLSSLSLVEKALFLAEYSNIPISDQRLLNFIGYERSYAATLYRKLFPKYPKLRDPQTFGAKLRAAGLEEDARAIPAEFFRELKKAIFLSLSAEKGSDPFLYSVQGTM